MHLGGGANNDPVAENESALVKKLTNGLRCLLLSIKSSSIYDRDVQIYISGR